MYELNRFGGDSVQLSDKHYAGLASVLLGTGKFVQLENNEIVNISEIRSITKVKKHIDIDISKIEL